jgi:hypothetical protein
MLKSNYYLLNHSFFVGTILLSVFIKQKINNLVNKFNIKINKNIETRNILINLLSTTLTTTAIIYLSIINDINFDMEKIQNISLLTNLLSY